MSHHLGDQFFLLHVPAFLKESKRLRHDEIITLIEMGIARCDTVGNGARIGPALIRRLVDKIIQARAI